MRLRTSGAYTIGLAIALALGVATAAGAQADTTKSRVPVKKEQPAPTKSQPGVPVMKETAPEPVAPAPSVTRTDTMPRAAAGEVVTPKDTMVATVAPGTCAMMPTAEAKMPKAMMENCGMMQQPQPRANPTRYLFGTSGFYLGVGAGTATPFNVLHDMGYDTGFDLTIPIGWQRPGRALGVRATLAYDQIHADKATADVTAPAMLGSAPDPKIYSGTIDALLKFPIGNSVRDGRGLSFYAVGGGGAYLFRGFGGTTALSDMLGGDKIGSSGKNVHKWGVQAGAGLEYGLGPTAVFVESRWVNVFTKGSTSGNDYLRWIPISVGVTLR
jgi:hypothetical protein